MPAPPPESEPAIASAVGVIAQEAGPTGPVAPLRRGKIV
jgi:hypothetical protein